MSLLSELQVFSEHVGSSSTRLEIDFMRQPSGFKVFSLPFLRRLGEKKSQAKASNALVVKGRILVLCLRTFSCRALPSFSRGPVEWLSFGPGLEDFTIPELSSTT